MPEPTTGGTNSTQTDASEVPIEIQNLANDVHDASVTAQSFGGPQNCATSIPSIPVATDADVAAAVVNYVSAVVGVQPSEVSSDTQVCGTSSTATCANMFQNNVAHFGGQLSSTIYAAAQRLEGSASHVGITILTPTKDGLTLQANVVLAGIQNGWLVSVAVFGDRLQCD